MALTPADVANKLFGKEFRGYAMEEVDAFLDEVEVELARLLSVNAELSRGNSLPDSAARPVPASARPVVEPGATGIAATAIAEASVAEPPAAVAEPAAGVLAEPAPRWRRRNPSRRRCGPC